MIRLVPLLVLVVIAGCETGIVVHDKDRAAELIVDCLSSFKSEQGRRLAYEWTDDRYKDDVSFGDFLRLVHSIRLKNQGADIRLAGYEVFGATRKLVVYANSKIGEDSFFYRFTQTGTRTDEYYLLDLSTSDSGFSKNGIYQEFERLIVVSGV